jgi:hypothetical protein
MHFLAGAAAATLRSSARSTTTAKLSLLYRPSVPASACPYRLLDEQGQEIAWANTFLDAQRVRQLSLRSLRAYAYDLLHFARWLLATPPPQPARPLSDMTESTLLDYVRHQLDQQPPPAPPTVNRRLTIVHCLYRFHYGREISPGQSHFQRPYTRRPRSMQPARRGVARGLHCSSPARRRPLCASRQFWRSFGPSAIAL